MVDVIRYGLPVVGKLDRLLKLINNNNFFFVLGKPTQWDDEQTPPFPLDEVESVEEPIVIKQAEFVTAAVISDCGEKDFRNCGFTNSEGNKLTIIDLENTSIKKLKKINPTYLYISVKFLPSELPEDTFRIIGVFNNIIFKPNVNNQKIVFSPEEVQEYKQLYWISYSTPVIKQINKITNLEVILNI